MRRPLRRPLIEHHLHFLNLHPYPLHLPPPDTVSLYLTPCPFPPASPLPMSATPGANLNVLDIHKRMALYWAPPDVRQLLVDPAVQQLFDVCRDANQSSKTSELAKQKGFDPNAQWLHGWSVLMQCMLYGNRLDACRTLSHIRTRSAPHLWCACTTCVQGIGRVAFVHTIRCATPCVGQCSAPSDATHAVPHARQLIQWMSNAGTSPIANSVDASCNAPCTYQHSLPYNAR